MQLINILPEALPATRKLLLKNTCLFLMELSSRLLDANVNPLQSYKFISSV